MKWSESNNFHRPRPTFKEIYLKEGLTWSFVTSGMFTARYYPCGFLWDVAGSPCVIEDKTLFNYVLGYLSTKIANNILKIINPTINFQVIDIQRVPILIDENYFSSISTKTTENIFISRNDWDTFETSWDFKVSPLIDFRKYVENHYYSLQENGIIIDREPVYIANLEHAYEQYKEFTNLKFDQLKSNEEELNRIFIEIYGLEDELTPQVSDKDITITKIFDTKDEVYDDIRGNQYILTKEDVMKSLISYAVGCMFGRYSLDIEGLAYAGGEWDDSKYSTFIPAEDNIILISDEEYFEDDIVNRFVDFVRTTYGKDTLEENLKFIADALGGNGTPKEVIRNYFIKDFYKDHLKTYKKRPIYWQYDSGRQNGFKALIYMHRYNKDTTGKLRIDYLHEAEGI